MLLAWKYRDRGAIIQRLDPRARMIFMLCMTFSLYFLWDLRWVIPYSILAIVQFVLARISFRESKTFWFTIGAIAIFLSILTSLTGSRLTGYVTETHPLFTGETYRLLYWDVTPGFTVEQLVFLITQVLRILAFAFLAIVIPYTYNPSQYGITFRGLGIGDKFAYAMDLSFRLVPSTARDFTIILDAQRARGYEVDKLRGGIVAKIRRLAPLVIPLVIGAIINGEEIADAMDLRAFGIQKRTWLPELIYTNADRILIGVSFFLLALAFIARVAWDAHMVWVPPFLLELASG